MLFIVACLNSYKKTPVKLGIFNFLFDIYSRDKFDYKQIGDHNGYLHYNQSYQW